MYAKATLAFSTLEFFTTHQWRFLSNNPIRLLEEMSNQDKKTFYFDVREIEWKSYFDVFIQGARRFVLKDDPSTLPLARRNLSRYSCKFIMNKNKRLLFLIVAYWLICRLYVARMFLRLLFFFGLFTVLWRSFRPFLLPVTAAFFLTEFLSDKS